jgi:hypothetical protein
MARSELSLVRSSGSTGTRRAVAARHWRAMLMRKAAGRMRRWFPWMKAILQGKGGGAAERQLQLLEVLPLGSRRQLMLVRCESERFLVGTGPDSVTSMLRIHEAPRPFAESTLKDAVGPWE